MHMCKKKTTYRVYTTYKNVSDGTTLNMKIFMHIVQDTASLTPRECHAAADDSDYAIVFGIFAGISVHVLRRSRIYVACCMGQIEGESVPEKFSDWMKTKGKEKHYIDAFSLLWRRHIRWKIQCRASFILQYIAHYIARGLWWGKHIQFPR